MSAIYVGCDKVKFSFARIGEGEAYGIWNRIKEETAYSAGRNGLAAEVVIRAMGGAHKSVYHSGKRGRDTFAVYSWDMTGAAAAYVFPFLPSWSFNFVRTIHAKSYYESIDAAAYLALKSAATNAPMFRQITVFSPQKFRKDGGQVGKLPGMRIGHAQSDKQVIIYKRGGTPMSIEARVDGDVLKRLIKELKETYEHARDDVSTTALSLLYTVAGEAHAYLNRIKEQCGMSNVAVTGKLMTHEELSALWGMLNFEQMQGQSSLYDNHGFPLAPIVASDEPVRGNIDNVTGAAVEFNGLIEETGELE